MATVLLVIHLMIAAAMVAVVLMQRSEGGALGIGGSGGGGGGGFLTGRGQANFLTRLTAALAIGFFTTSILLTMVGQRTSSDESIFDSTTAPASSTTAPAGDTKETPAKPDDAPSGGILDKLQ
jgi:preprotein translocase subunit SecG